MKTLKQIYMELLSNPIYTDNNPGTSGLGVQGQHPYVDRVGDKQWAQPKGEYDVPPNGIQPNEPIKEEEKEEELPGNDSFLTKAPPVGTPIPLVGPNKSMGDTSRQRRLGFRRR